jgi:hypothetical protein
MVHAVCLTVFSKRSEGQKFDPPTSNKLARSMTQVIAIIERFVELLVLEREALF